MGGERNCLHSLLNNKFENKQALNELSGGDISADCVQVVLYGEDTVSFCIYISR